MYRKLSALLQKPPLYEKTSARFWNDPHISKSMLQAHLDPTTDAASRKPEFIERSVQWISSLVPPGSALLDIGCGPGLYTKLFAERGFLVTGLDFSERSIAYAREHDPASRYVLGDYLKLDYREVFDLITLIWCDYGALIPADRQNLLGRVRRALKPGGLFLFDVFTPEWKIGFPEDTSWEIHDSGGFWSPQPHLCLGAEYHYGDHVALSRSVVIESDGQIRCFNIWNTCFTKESLARELEPLDFASIDYYTDVKGEPYDEEALTICAVAKKRRPADRPAEGADSRNGVR